MNADPSHFVEEWAVLASKLTPAERDRLSGLVIDELFPAEEVGAWERFFLFTSRQSPSSKTFEELLDDPERY